MTKKLKPLGLTQSIKNANTKENTKILVNAMKGKESKGEDSFKGSYENQNKEGDINTDNNPKEPKKAQSYYLSASSIKKLEMYSFLISVKEKRKISPSMLIEQFIENIKDQDLNE